jgi:large subunit ribosomal protein L15
MPLQMRLPKVGFRPQRPANQVVNLADLTRKGLAGDVSPDVLKSAGLIRSANRPVKVLAEGEVSVALHLQGVSVSIQAARKIETAGGSVSGARLATPKDARRHRKSRPARRPAAQDAPPAKESE